MDWQATVMEITLMSSMLSTALILFSAPLSEGKPNANDIVATALAARSRIANLHLIVLTEAKSRDLVTNAWSEQTIKREVWKKGDKLRTDATTLVSSLEPKSVNVRDIVCRNGERAGYAIKTAQSQASISPVQVTKIDENFNNAHKLRMDWTRLGFQNAAMFQYRHQDPDFYIRQISNPSPSADVSPATVVETIIDGKVIYTIRRSQRNGSYVEFAFCHNYDCNPTRYTTKILRPESNGDDDRFMILETMIEYVQHLQSGIWYPSLIISKNTQGRNDIEVEKLTVKSADINTPVDDSIFLLRAMDLYNGTPIVTPDISKYERQPTWQDGVVDPSRTVGSEAKAAHDRIQELQKPVAIEDPQRRWPYITGAITAFVFAVILFRKRSINPH